MKVGAATALAVHGVQPRKGGQRRPWGCMGCTHSRGRAVTVLGLHGVYPRQGRAATALGVHGAQPRQG